MEVHSVVVNCPKQLKATFVAYDFLIKAYLDIKKTKYNKIILNMKKTKFFDTNLLAVLFFFIDELCKEKKDIGVILPNEEIFYRERAIYAIFNYYAEDKRAFFKPRFISDENAREKEDVLLKYLKKIELEKYDIVKTLISEMFANIEMHTNNKIGCIAGHYSKEKNVIIISIVNMDYSIAKQLEKKRGMIFEDDFFALMWSLRKSNSTRNEDESGGLGLYLLRKYIYELNGIASILTGNCYIEFDYKCYDAENENSIHINEKKKMDYEYQGTIITLHIPYTVDKQEVRNNNEELPSINLLDMMEK